MWEGLGEQFIIKSICISEISSYKIKQSVVCLPMRYCSWVGRKILTTLDIKFMPMELVFIIQALSNFPTIGLDRSVPVQHKMKINDLEFGPGWNIYINNKWENLPNE